MTFKVVTSIFNFYIPTSCMVCLYVKIFLAIKRRTKDIQQFGAYTATGGTSAKPAERKPKPTTTSAPLTHGTCGIKSIMELPMTNVAVAMRKSFRQSHRKISAGDDNSP